MDQIYIQVRFKKEYNGIEYNDALYFTEEEYKAMKAEDIEAMKEERLTSFKAIIDNPPVEVEPTKEQLEEHAANIQKELDELNAKIAEKEIINNEETIK